ncbi:efflux RND transporter periplasmic adaptor subunit [Aureimonas psammosilenae]|uniref:efflux RND transporter periplasmic adaptor subunit n=1 Tax=Aureimonas psammosilenae TaxID=2495496 RepID=UPI001869981E|nr:efflux RND transporter periplasmic adaptor subunit [Aureimonas psammosilenae]
MRLLASPLFPTGSLVVVAFITSGCGSESAPPQQQPERVVVRSVAYKQVGSDISLTGSVAARVESQLSFQIDGQVIERYVEVSSHVRAGDLLAKLDSRQQLADFASAEASVRSSQSSVRDAQVTFDRQSQLLKSGVTTKGNFENAREQLRNAQGALATAEANLGSARKQLSFTELRADADGIITARNTETGQVAAAAQSVFTLAHDGEREAIFNAYEAILLEASPKVDFEVRLVGDPKVVSKARVREISPTFDTQTGTVRVRTTLIDPPSGMGLGAAVEGVGRTKVRPLVELPWTALSADAHGAAVWVVDAATNAVSLRSVTIADYRTGRVFVSDGVRDGEKVVTAGAQLLRAGQVVALAGDAGA